MCYHDVRLERSVHVAPPPGLEEEPPVSIKDVVEMLTMARFVSPLSGEQPSPDHAASLEKIQLMLSMATGKKVVFEEL